MLVLDQELRKKVPSKQGGQQQGRQQHQEINSNSKVVSASNVSVYGWALGNNIFCAFVTHQMTNEITNHRIPYSSG
jgi:hypothetical protein